MMEICRQTSLIYADYCYFLSSGNIKPFWTYQNFSSWLDVHVHPPPPPHPFMDEVLSRGNFSGGSLMGGNFPGGNFAGENFPRTFSYISSVSHIDIFLIQKAKPYGLIGERDVIARVFGTV